MEVVALGRLQILRNLAFLLPHTLLAGFVYFVLLASALRWLFDGWLRADLVKPLAYSGAAVVILLGGAWYVRFAVTRLTRWRLALLGDELLIRWVGLLGARERRYQLHELDAVAFGERLNAFERALDWIAPQDFAREWKAGRLSVTDKAGRRIVLDLIDKVFDPRALSAFAAELSRHGVSVIQTRRTRHYTGPL